MSFETTIEGLEAFKAHVTKAFDALEADLREATLVAAADGIRAEQAEHPYRDWRLRGRSYRWRGALGLTDTAHAEQRSAGNLRNGFTAEMVWPADYAAYVNALAGYAFTPIAEQHAEYALEVYARAAIEKFRTAMGG